MKTVYFIEKDETLRDSVKMYLESEGFEVEVYAFSTEFLIDLTSGCRADVYVIGEMIPMVQGSSGKAYGYDLVRQIRSVCPEAKTIGLVMHEEQYEKFLSVGSSIVYIGDSADKLKDAVFALAYT